MWRRGLSHVEADRHDEVETNYVPSGSLTYVIAERLMTIEPREPALLARELHCALLFPSL